MKRLMIVAAVLGLSGSALAAPAPAAKPAHQLPPECVEQLKRHAEKLKKELGLSDAQAEAIRAENQRYRAELLAGHLAHRIAVDRILTPEQKAKADAKRAAFGEKRKARMAKRADACRAADDEDDDGR
jgi:Spy/CpxP family protein refolding chaperone